MDNSKQNVFASATSESPPSPIQGRPVGTGHHPVSNGGARSHPGSAVLAPSPSQEPASVAPETREPEIAPVPSWRKALSVIAGARWALAIPAVVLTIYAGNLVEQARVGNDRQPVPPLLAWQLFALSGILLAIAAFRLQPLLPAGPSIFLRSLRGMKRKLFFVIPLGLSILCSLASIPLFISLNAATDQNPVSGNWLVNTGSWLLFIASLLLFGIAWVVWERSTPGPQEGTQADPPEDRLPRWVEYVIMAALLGVALFLRVPDLANVPPGLWFDEAYHGEVGLRLFAPNATHATFVPDIVHFGSLYFYFLGAIVKVVGNIVWPLRILPALAGSLCVPMIYLLASRLYGWRAGLAAAGFLAFSSWNITFSRFGMVGMFTAGLDVATFLCVAQGLRTGRLGYYAGAGVLLGLASQTYYTFRMDAIALVLVTGLLLVTQRMRAIKAIRAGLVVFMFGGIIASVPIDLYAVQHWDEYNSRLDTVSVLSPQNSPTEQIRNQNLQNNFNAHMLMFNWRGDNNGRHNLSGTPMLDWIVAALFFAGLASCLVRGWRWQYAFPVLWFAFTLLGGILTLPFEAPQSHRTLENSIVTALLAGIFAGEAARVLSGARMVERLRNFFGMLCRRGRVVSKSRAFPWAVRGAWAVGGAALLLVVWLAGSMDYHKYFEVQARDMGVWKDMYAPQTHAADVSLRYGANYDVYMAPILKGLPPSEYLAPNVQTLDWPGMQALPLSTQRPGGVIVILDLPSAADVASIARMYPHAKFELFTAPSSPEVLIYTITIPTSDIKALEGVRVLSGASGTGGVDKSVPEFTDDAGTLGMSSGQLVRLSASLRVDSYGKYTFGWQTADGTPGTGQLTVDGYNISASQSLTMGPGLHSVVLTGGQTQSSGQAARLVWGLLGTELTPVPTTNLFDPKRAEPHGLTGAFAPGLGTDAPPTMGRIDPVISFNFHHTPLPRPYTAVWMGKIYIPQDGQYTFGTEQLNTSRLFFDGTELIINNTVNNLVERQLQVTKGFHDIKIIYTDGENYSHMYLYWTPPGRPHSIIPSVFLWPEMGSYPDQPESGAWPTLGESDGSQLPPDRVTFFPPRVRGQQGQAQPQDQGAAAPPPPPPPSNQPPPPGKELHPLFTMGEEGVPLPRPRAAATDGDANIYVFTETDSAIHKFDAKGKPIASWNVHAADGKPLSEGSALLVKDDQVMLLDATTSDMLVFTLDGKEAGRVHLCACFFPRGAALARDGSFWIANTGGNQVLKVSPLGQQLEVVGGKGTEPGKLMEPAGVWEAPDGTLYVADIDNSRVQAFTPDHKPLAQWNMGRSIARDGNRLSGDGQGHIVVTQLEGTAIVEYDEQGKELSRWYYAPGGSALVPSGIASLGGGKFIALFQDGNLAAVFSLK